MSAEIIFIDPNDSRREDKPHAKFEIMGEFDAVLVDGLMPLRLARQVARIVDLYNQGRPITVTVSAKAGAVQ